MRWKRILLPVALAAGLATPGIAADDAAARFAQTFRRADRRCTDWQFCKDRELPRLWRLAGEYLAARLQAHPGATAGELVAAITRLDRELPHRHRHAPEVEGSAAKLGNGDFIVALRYFETGTVFIIGPEGVRWSIASALRSWRPPSRPSYGSILLLPSGANGNPRFLVEGLRAGNGMTVAAQTSAWRWDGREARLLAVDEHLEMIDDDRPTTIDHDLVIVPTKEIMHAFISCGASNEPSGTWTLRLTANGAESLGHQWVHPELRWADDFFLALSKGRPVERFATAAVVRQLRQHRGKDAIGEMVMELHIEGAATHLVTDADSYTFTFDPRHAGLYAVAVRFE